MSADDCPFCDIIAGEDPNDALWQTDEHVSVIRPLNPVTPGHLLVLPTLHHTHTDITGPLLGYVFERAHVLAKLSSAYRDFNLITSSGSDATQTIEHVHVHVVPRKPKDGLSLPWSAR